MYNFELCVEKELISQEQISKRVKELAREIESIYKGEKITAVCILRGSFMFFADLVREINLDIEIEFMAISSYSNSTKSNGNINVVKDLNADVKGKNILIIEDIIDSGHTLVFLREYFLSKKPKSLRVCALLDKKGRREVEAEGDLVGFDIPNEFIIGYGLDYAEKFRTLKSVCVLKKEVYEKNGN